jgi:hypothetical protein
VAWFKYALEYGLWWTWFGIILIECWVFWTGIVLKLIAEFWLGTGPFKTIRLWFGINVTCCGGI